MIAKARDACAIREISTALGFEFNSSLSGSDSTGTILCPNSNLPGVLC